MSLHVSAVAIEGNVLSKLSGLFEKADYRIAKTTKVNTSSEAGKHLGERQADPNTVVKVAYLQDGWTIIVDPELILFAEKDLLADFSNELQAKILGWICEGGSGTYGFVFINNNSIRSKMSVDGESVEDEGEPIPEEEGISWEKVFEDDILKLAERIGAPYRYLEEDREYFVFFLDESDMSESEVASPPPSVPQKAEAAKPSTPAPAPASKKWWQFWR